MYKETGKGQIDITKQIWGKAIHVFTYTHVFTIVDLDLNLSGIYYNKNSTPTKTQSTHIVQ